MEPDAAGGGLYPVFKEHGWRGRSFVPHVSFLSIPDHPMPVIAYARSTADAYEFMTSAEFAERTSADVQAEAQRNLAALPLSWERLSPTLLRGADHDFAAEMLLDPSRLQDAQRMLGSDTIVVGVPRRRTIFASSAAAGSAEETAFVRAVWEAGVDDRNDTASITNLLFRLDRDQVVGFEIVHPPGGDGD